MTITLQNLWRPQTNDGWHEGLDLVWWSCVDDQALQNFRQRFLQLGCVASVEQGAALAVHVV